MELFKIANPDSLYLPKCLFRLIGLTTNSHDRQVFLYIGTVIVLSCWAAVFASITKMMIRLNHGEDFNFTIFGMTIWITYTSFSYSFIYLQMNFGQNLFLFVEEISQPETNDYGKIRSPLYRPSNLQTLNQMAIIWICLSAFFSLIATVGSILIFGPTRLITDTVPSFGNKADVLYIILLFISNVTCPIPMVIVRLSSYFAECRILGMIHYLETENEHLHDVPIASLMGWYDEVYRINVQLTKAVSPYVTCALLVMLPQSVFLSQVCLALPHPSKHLDDARVSSCMSLTGLRQSV
jgi:hypothetical protein